VQKKFKRCLDSLAEIFAVIDQFAREQQVDADSKHALSLAIDELFTNMVKHQPSNTNDITIDLRTEGDVMIVQLADHDVDRFDPTKKTDPYVGEALGERKSGGLGIYLTKKLVDDIQYHYSDRTSVVRLKKNYRRQNV
jgi:serine/threonine-protein kinase RsbW